MFEYVSGVIYDGALCVGKSRGYAFIEFEREEDMTSAYKRADGRKVDDRRIQVDVERGRTVKNWRPTRLGGGLGGRKMQSKSEAVPEGPRRLAQEKPAYAVGRLESSRGRDEVVGEKRVREEESDRRGVREDRGGRDREREREDRGRDTHRDRDRERERDRGRDSYSDRDRDRGSAGGYGGGRGGDDGRYGGGSSRDHSRDERRPRSRSRERGRGGDRRY